jgi:hypothetical protein
VVGCTTGSREVPGERKPVIRCGHDDDDDDDIKWLSTKTTGMKFNISVIKPHKRAVRKHGRPVLWETFTAHIESDIYEIYIQYL